MTFETDWQNGSEARGPSSRGSQLRFAPLTSAITLIVHRKKMKFILPLLILTISLAQAATQIVYMPSLGDIVVKDDTLGPEWKRIDGLVIPFFKDLNGLDEKTKKQALLLKDRFLAMGVNGVADFSFSKKEFPLDTATCRIFVFASPGYAKKWWKQKYEFSGWEEQYEKHPHPNGFYLDSKSGTNPKRIMLLSNLMISSHHIQKGDEHLTLLNAVLKELGNYGVNQAR